MLSRNKEDSSNQIKEGKKIDGMGKIIPMMKDISTTKDPEDENQMKQTSGSMMT